MSVQDNGNIAPYEHAAFPTVQTAAQALDLILDGNGPGGAGGGGSAPVVQSVSFTHDNNDDPPTPTWTHESTYGDDQTTGPLVDFDENPIEFRAFLQQGSDNHPEGLVEAIYLTIAAQPTAQSEDRSVYIVSGTAYLTTSTSDENGGDDGEPITFDFLNYFTLVTQFLTEGSMQVGFQALIVPGIISDNFGFHPVNLVFNGEVFELLGQDGTQWGADHTIIAGQAILLNFTGWLSNAGG